MSSTPETFTRNKIKPCIIHGWQLDGVGTDAARHLPRQEWGGFEKQEQRVLLHGAVALLPAFKQTRLIVFIMRMLLKYNL